MRNILFFLALLTILVACDDGSSRPTTNSNRSVPRLLPTEPPLNVPDEPQVSPAFGREFDARLGTPRPLFDETETSVDPTPPPVEDVIAEPTATTSLLGTPFPTRGGFPTSTPYQ